MKEPDKTKAELRLWRALVDESQELSSGPYRLTNEAIDRSRIRFDAAQELIAGGETEAARRVFWWPRNEDPPKAHWSRVPIQACACRRRVPEGPLALCGICGGATDETPSSIPIRVIAKA